MLSLQAGKRYVTRNGRITEPLINSLDGSDEYPFEGQLSDHEEAWTAEGKYYCNDVRPDELDLIRECPEDEGTFIMPSELLPSGKTVTITIHGVTIVIT